MANEENRIKISTQCSGTARTCRRSRLSRIRKPLTVMAAGIFITIAAWASFQRGGKDETPYWRTVKTDGELNAKYPGGVEAQGISKQC